MRKGDQAHDNQTELVHAVVAFYEGARRHATGLLLRNNKVIMSALTQLQESLAAIDAASETGRDVLIPFLRHADAMVRCEAAQALHPARRDLAIPILQDIDLTCTTEAREAASFFLLFAGEPHHGGEALSKLHPYKYDDRAYQDALRRNFGADA